MRRSGFAGCFLAALAAVTIAQAMAQQDEGPILRPKPKPASAKLLVICDLACTWKLDGKPRGTIAAGDSAIAPLSLGQHLVDASTEDGLDKAESQVEIKAAGQTIVHIALAPVRIARLKADLEAQDKAKRDQEAQSKVLNNQTVIDMVAGGLPSELILTRIRTSKTQFDLSTPALIDLNKKGVPAEVVHVMMDPTATPTPPAVVKPQPIPAADVNDPAAPHTPGIYLAVGSGASRKLVPMEPHEFTPKMESKVWVRVGGVADGREAKTKTSNAQPEFYVYFDEQGASRNPVSLGSAYSPLDLLLLRLTVSAESKREGLIMHPGLKRVNKSDPEYVSFTVTNVRTAGYRVTTASPLAAGEYGLLSLTNNEVDLWNLANNAQAKVKRALWLFDFSVPGGQ